jgi:hypothetical protein
MCIPKKLLAASLVMMSAFMADKSAQAGLFDASSYITGGDWDQTSNSYISFQDVGSLGEAYDGTNGSGTLGAGTGTAEFFEVGDIVYFFQDFSAIGGTTVNGTGGAPAAVYGISAYKAVTWEDTGNPAPPPSFSGRIGLGALGTTDFTGFLTDLGIDVSEVTIGATSTFALVSSNSNVTLSGNGSTDFSSFQADLIAGIGGTGFAQLSNPSFDDFYYSYYDAPGTVSVGSAAFNLRVGLNIESTDDGLLDFGSVSATPFDGSAVNVNLTTQAATATTAAQNYGTSTGGDPSSGSAPYYGSLDASLRIGSTVPEPNTLASLVLIGVTGLVARRQRRR